MLKSVSYLFGFGEYRELFDHTFTPPWVAVAALHNLLGSALVGIEEQSAAETVAIRKSDAITRQIVGAKFFIVGCYPIKDIAQQQYISVAQKNGGQFSCPPS